MMNRGSSVEETARVESVIAQELIQISMVGVRSRLDDVLLDPTARVAEFSRIAAGHNRHFQDGVRRKRQVARVALHFGDQSAHAIDLHFLRERWAAVDVRVEGAVARPGVPPGVTPGDRKIKFSGALSRACGGEREINVGLRVDLTHSGRSFHSGAREPRRSLQSSD